MVSLNTLLLTPSDKRLVSVSGRSVLLDDSKFITSNWVHRSLTVDD